MSSYPKSTSINKIFNSPAELISHHPKNECQNLKNEINNPPDTESLTQTIEGNTSNDYKFSRNDVDDFYMQGINYLDDQNLLFNDNLASIFRDENDIEGSGKNYEANISRKNSYWCINDLNNRTINSKQSSFNKEQKNATSISVNRKAKTSFFALNSYKDSSLTEDKLKYSYLRNKVDPNSENGVDELMKLFPLNCCDQMVRTYIETKTDPKKIYDWVDNFFLSRSRIRIRKNVL